jgi:hypothetical protein
MLSQVRQNVLGFIVVKERKMVVGIIVVRLLLVAITNNPYRTKRPMRFPEADYFNN